MTMIITELSEVLQSLGADEQEANTASAAVVSAIMQRQPVSALEHEPVSAQPGPAQMNPAVYAQMSDADWKKLPLEQRIRNLFGKWPLNEPVKLDKKASLFDRKRSDLKEAGFSWNKQQFQWEPPSNS